MAWVKTDPEALKFMRDAHDTREFLGPEFD